MSFRSVSVLAIVLFLSLPSIDNIGVRAQPDCSCSTLCADVRRTDPERNMRACINAGVNLCGCRCGGGGGLLHAASQTNCVVCVTLLTRPPSNCPCDDTDSAGNTPLHRAAAICNTQIFGALLNAGCNENAVNNDGDTPICLAADPPNNNNCGQVVRNLVMNGADNAFVCGDGQQPCARTRNPNTREVLRQDGAPNCPPQTG